MAKPQRRALIVAALLLGVFLSALEATVVATVMPTVIAELGGITLYGWVASSYLLVSTVSVRARSVMASRSSSSGPSRAPSRRRSSC
jgi:MFS family permease